MKTNQEIETDKWNIIFEHENILTESLIEGYLRLFFRIKNKEKDRAITEKSLEELKLDLKDLGKWRKFKELKKDLENENGTS